MASSSPTAPLLVASLSALALVACRGEVGSLQVDFLNPEVELSTREDGRVELDGAFDLTANLALGSGEDEAEIWLDKLDVTTTGAPFTPVVTDLRVPNGDSLFPLEAELYDETKVRVPFTGVSLKAPGDELAWLCSIGQPMELQGAVYEAETATLQSYYDSAAQLERLPNEITFSRKDAAAKPLPPRFVSIPAQGPAGFLPAFEVENAWGGFVFGAHVANNLNLGERVVLADGAGQAVLVRFDAHGKVVWDRTFGDEGVDGISSLSAQEGGDLYVAGHFTTQIDLGAGALLNTPGQRGYFVARMSDAGAAAWSVGLVEDAFFPLENCLPPGPHIAARPDGGVSFVKSLYGTIPFPGGPVEATPPADYCSADLLITGYDAAGELLYVRRYGDEYDQQVLDAVADAEGNTWIVGLSNGALDLGNGLPLIVGPMSSMPVASQLFVAAFDPQGTPIVARELGQVHARLGYEVHLAARPGGGVVVAGPFAGFIDLGLEVVTTTGVGEDGFVVALDGAGKQIWGQYFDQSASPFAEAFTLGDVDVAEDGRVVLAGRAMSGFNVSGQPLPGGTPTFGAGIGSALFTFALDPAGAPLGYRILSCNAGLMSLAVGAGEVTLVSAVLGFSEGEHGLLPRNEGALWMGRLALDP
ncbi:hypothetical protein [Polyangium jinanense]|uniref:Uncharacterized protein n=1 Tax=Polyangium jinanense TaxID=2829994 RepID=A0A9X4AW09_9BACT|nr:hypothetical protein [Polyangium jinanense]MDC3956767.1 hypothetical protein [Polyangium jinanense]MDC3984830.1 hypothetical protein [Polyangium jinanense]